MSLWKSVVKFSCAKNYGQMYQSLSFLLQRIRGCTRIQCTVGSMELWTTGTKPSSKVRLPNPSSATSLYQFPVPFWPSDKLFASCHWLYLQRSTDDNWYYTNHCFPFNKLQRIVLRGAQGNWTSIISLIWSTWWMRARSTQNKGLGLQADSCLRTHLILLM